MATMTRHWAQQQNTTATWHCPAYAPWVGHELRTVTDLKRSVLHCCHLVLQQLSHVLASQERDLFLQVLDENIKHHNWGTNNTIISQVFNYPHSCLPHLIHEKWKPRRLLLRTYQVYRTSEGLHSELSTQEQPRGKKMFQKKLKASLTSHLSIMAAACELHRGTCIFNMCYARSQLLFSTTSRSLISLSPWVINLSHVTDYAIRGCSLMSGVFWHKNFAKSGFEGVFQ